MKIRVATGPASLSIRAETMEGTGEGQLRDHFPGPYISNN